MSGYPPIEDHGVVGDLATVALVATDATIDFLCWPRFDSPTVFASLLDPDVDGGFLVAPRLGAARRGQHYLPESNILTTRFLSAEGMAEVTDFMPVCVDGAVQAVVRQVTTVRGEIDYRATCAPRFDYARVAHRTAVEGGSALFRPDDGGPALALRATVPLEIHGGDAVASFTLRAGETATFVLADPGHGEAAADPHAFGCSAFAATLGFWRGWSAASRYRGRWRETVGRSALALKLLVSHAHGSLVAAPTFGLPEAVGGERNWDYRYTWVRDAAFTSYALIRLGYTAEAQAFMRWMAARAGDCGGDGTLRIVYGIDGRAELPEESLPHLAGYRGSSPVRVGNAASGQLQLDIYGELMDAVYLSSKHGEPVSYDAWRHLTRTIDWVCANWRQPDAGIWEVRGEPREFLHSRLMCWVAVDRALRLAQKRSLPAPYARWFDARNELHHDIFASFWDGERRSFVQHRGSRALDAAVLLMPMVRFVGPTDPRWLSTLDAIGRDLADDALVRRYDGAGASDGLSGSEGSFTACSFWYVECLARAGRLDESRLLFEKLLGYANHLGLYAEELGADGSHLGNFPQALTHLALISAATCLDRALDGSRAPWSG